jgi:pimeloyl-ACP methyl ester carboxylesterase
MYKLFLRQALLIYFTLFMLSSCSNATRERETIMIREQGSFAIGGKILRDERGNTFHGDHGYVFYQIPVNARKYPLVFAHGVGQFTKTWETTPDGREGFQNIFLRRGFGVYLVNQPRRGNAGRGTETVTITPSYDEQIWFNRFRVGIYPDYFEEVQFPKDEESLNQYFRQMTPAIGTVDFDVYSDAYAALFDKIGQAIFVTHSQGGPVGWRTLLKTRNIKAIVSYEPGGELPFPAGKVPALGSVKTLSGKTEGVEVPVSVFMEYAKIPIIIYFGDNLPETADEYPEQYEWTMRLKLTREWAQMLNDLGGDVTVIHLPDAGLHGNTHFPFSDLNNIEVADLLSSFLKEKGLD